MDDLLERVQQTGAPLVDDETATFLWEGDQAPQLVGDFNGWGRRSSETLFRKVGPRVWRCTIPLPSDAYLEYSYRLGGERIHDPLNPNLVSDGVGGFHNWFSMPGFHETPLTEEQPHGVKGTVTHHEVECGMFAMGETRTVRLYQPPVDEACPLLVVLDGQEYLERGRLVNIVDNLIGQGRIRPINMALVDHGGRARVIEYNCSDSTIGFLERVETLAREHLSLLEDPALNGVLGASMGGLMALYAALRAPMRFGRVLSQSGAFGVVSGAFESVVYDVVRHARVRPAIWMDVGRYEALLTLNRGMHEILTEHGHDVVYREFNGGHNYVCWRNEVWRGIEVLYGLE